MCKKRYDNWYMYIYMYINYMYTFIFLTVYHTKDYKTILTVGWKRRGGPEKGREKVCGPSKNPYSFVWKSFAIEYPL